MCKHTGSKGAFSSRPEAVKAGLVEVVQGNLPLGPLELRSLPKPGGSYFSGVNLEGGGDGASPKKKRAVDVMHPWAPRRGRWWDVPATVGQRQSERNEPGPQSVDFAAELGVQKVHVNNSTVFFKCSWLDMIM